MVGRLRYASAIKPAVWRGPPHSILAEFDVSVSEYRSLGWYPQGPADLWAHRMQQLALTQGVVGVNIHTDDLMKCL
jgi:hypothetical protein